MAKMEQIEKLHTQETQARDKYEETKDTKFLETLLTCMKKREELLFKTIPEHICLMKKDKP